MIKWSNLRKNKCPKCERDLADKLQGDYFICSCGFMISTGKFREIVNNTAPIQKEERHYRPRDEEPENYY